MDWSTFLFVVGNIIWIGGAFAVYVAVRIYFMNKKTKGQKEVNIRKFKSLWMDATRKIGGPGSRKRE